MKGKNEIEKMIVNGRENTKSGNENVNQTVTKYSSGNEIKKKKVTKYSSGNKEQ